MGGQWPKVLDGAPLGTLPVSLSMKWSVGPSPTVKISNPGISMKMPSFPKRKQKPFNRTGPCFHPWFPSSLVDLTESGGGSGPPGHQGEPAEQELRRGQAAQMTFCGLDALLALLSSWRPQEEGTEASKTSSNHLAQLWPLGRYLYLINGTTGPQDMPCPEPGSIVCVCPQQAGVPGELSPAQLQRLALHSSGLFLVFRG